MLLFTLTVLVPAAILQAGTQLDWIAWEASSGNNNNKKIHWVNILIWLIWDGRWMVYKHWILSYSLEVLICSTGAFPSAILSCQWLFRFKQVGFERTLTYIFKWEHCLVSFSIALSVQQPAGFKNLRKNFVSHSRQRKNASFHQHSVQFFY